MTVQKEDFHILRIMGEVDRDGSRTQRELSARLNISLGLVNTFMKRLVNKGYFKVKTLPRNRLKYFLTPKGLTQKSRLTIEYLKYSAHFYREVKELLLEKFEMLEEQGVKRVLFWGTGEVAELAYLYLQQTGVQLRGIIDEQGNGQHFFGFPVEHLDRLHTPDWDRILVTRLDDPERDVRVLMEQGIARDRIITL
ncbi:MAG: winged helix-turn-helix transcriptional regulator [Deltaproteobacteria bacterium]|nr:winged helix-turn-helix transcriptional regulator [Deltaproteobacteria bacterium]